MTPAALGECDLWPRGKSTSGYGVKSGPIDFKPIRAHRWIWEQVIGPIPDGVEIHHRCGTKLCVRPDHLEALTHAQHLRRHGRYTREDVFAALHAYEVRYGGLPNSTDWNPSKALENSRSDAIARFRADGCWPHYLTVRALFGSWREAISGYERVRTLQAVAS